jgi:hypothetical protein
MRLSDSKMNEKNLEKLEQEVSFLKSHITEKATDQNIEIQIDDIGFGMKKNVMENIFKTFYNTKQSGKGTGVGLVIVYNRLKDFNGLINFSSIYQQGTQFRILIPKNQIKVFRTARLEWCCWKDFSFSHASIQSVGIKTLKFVVTPLKTCFQGCMLEVQCVQNHRSFSRAKQPLNTIQVGQF